MRSETANSSGLNTLFSELAVVQSYALVVHTVGVVLSGMAGSDARDGAKELHDAGGIVIVQEPASCQFAEMPATVLEAVPEAIRIAPENLCERIAEITREIDQSAFDQKLLYGICGTMLKQSGCDFRLYHSNMVSRRVAHCMYLSRSNSLQQYAERLKKEPALVDSLVSKLLINVTSFFRDPETWRVVAQEVIPSVFLSADSFEVRVWVAGCSTGEEAFTLGMLILEHLRTRQQKEAWTVRIFATDIDNAALEYARQGRYPREAAGELTPALRDRYFIESGSGSSAMLEVVPALRHLMVFVPHNLLSNPPFISMNLVCCRNVMIFLKREAKATILGQLHRSLNAPHGFLVLGNSEQAGHGS